MIKNYLKNNKETMQVIIVLKLTDSEVIEKPNKEFILSHNKQILGIFHQSSFFLKG